MHIRAYTLRFLSSGTRVPRVELTPMGPSLDLSLRRHADPDPEMLKQAMKRPKLKKQDVEKGLGKRKKNMEERVETLAKKLVDRLRPFIEAKHPGDKDDPETKAFEARMRREADDLKLESFGVELLHTIGNVYIMKATSFLKSRKFLGM